LPTASGVTTDDLDEARLAKRWVTLGLGALWILDGLLQLQPQMFTNSLPLGVIANSDMSLPPPLYFATLKFLIGFYSHNVAILNAGIAGLQLLLGAMIILGSGGLRRIGLFASAGWGVVVWIFGEGLGGLLGASMTGGVFPGTPSIMNGFPGAALVYALVALLLLLPDSRWKLHGRVSAIRFAAGLLFLLAFAVQVEPLMWTSFGQESIFASNLGSLPGSLGGSVLLPLALFTASHPVLSNSLEACACLLSAFGVLTGRRAGYLFALGWLAFIWWFPLGLGGMLTGLGTDPNTPPAIALLVVPAFVASRKRARGPPEDAGV
jgi:hypothetical protein